MADSMIERVSLSMRNWMRLRGYYPELPNMPIETLARAAIEAMREPTEAMLDCLSTHGPGSNIVTHDQWRAAIDAALSGGE